MALNEKEQAIYDSFHEWGDELIEAIALRVITKRLIERTSPLTPGDDPYFKGPGDSPYFRGPSCGLIGVGQPHSHYVGHAMLMSNGLSRRDWAKEIYMSDPSAEREPKNMPYVSVWSEAERMFRPEPDFEGWAENTGRLPRQDGYNLTHLILDEAASLEAMRVPSEAFGSVVVTVEGRQFGKRAALEQSLKEGQKKLEKLPPTRAERRKEARDKSKRK
jgi:hypothetical protein